MQRWTATQSRSPRPTSDPPPPVVAVAGSLREAGCRLPRGPHVSSRRAAVSGALRVAVVPWGGPRGGGVAFAVAHELASPTMSRPPRGADPPGLLGGMPVVQSPSPARATPGPATTRCASFPLLPLLARGLVGPSRGRAGAVVVVANACALGANGVLAAARASRDGRRRCRTAGRLVGLPGPGGLHLRHGIRRGDAAGPVGRNVPGPADRRWCGRRRWAPPPGSPDPSAPFFSSAPSRRGGAWRRRAALSGWALAARPLRVGRGPSGWVGWRYASLDTAAPAGGGGPHHGHLVDPSSPWPRAPTWPTVYTSVRAPPSVGAGWPWSRRRGLPLLAGPPTGLRRGRDAVALTGATWTPSSSYARPPSRGAGPV